MSTYQDARQRCSKCGEPYNEDQPGDLCPDCAYLKAHGSDDDCPKCGGDGCQDCDSVMAWFFEHE